MASIHCYISGRVQGVWFRGWTQKTARAMGVIGWVRNLPDGRVECMARADGKTLQKFRAKLAKGPSFSRVDAVDCLEASAELAAPELAAPELAGLDDFLVIH